MAYATARSVSSVRERLNTVPSGLPSNNSASYYSATSSQSNYDMGANIIESGGTSSIGGAGGGGPVTDNNCSDPQSAVAVPISTARHSQSIIVPYNCQDWYLETVPGVENPADDLYVGTTCNSMWIPGNYTQTGGYTGGGDAGASTCAAGNVDNINLACLIAFVARTCTGAKNINQPASDTINKQHSNLISGELEVSLVRHGGGTQTLGWEYQTYGGQEYFQFAQTVSVNAGVVSVTVGPGAVIPFKGSVYGAVQGLAKILGTTQQSLPASFNTMTPLTQISKSTC